MKELFNEEQLIVLKEIAKNEDLVERVRWWTNQAENCHCCPMTISEGMALTNYCKQLCWKIWPDLTRRAIGCPCHMNKPAKEVAQIILEEAKNGNQD